MAIDTVTLEMIGRVSLHEFSTTVGTLESLLAVLTRTYAQGADIEWLMAATDTVEAESTLTTYHGLAADVAGVEQVVRAYGEVGTALQFQRPTGMPPPVEQEARRLVSVLNGRITSLRFETPEIDATVSTTSPPTQPSRALPGAYGAVEGRVQTLSSRGGLRFTLYDTLNDKAVGCYLADDFDPERLRGVWGRRAIVAGWVTRDAATGRPRTIRRVSDVVVLPEFGSDDYQRARGALSVPAGTESPEVTVRRLRDAD